MIAVMERVKQKVSSEAAPALRRYAQLTSDHPDREFWREQAIEGYVPLAGHLAQRFRGRGENFDDLVQVAMVGLIKAIDGYDPHHENNFVSYAVPTITGEIKRHFRDKTWDIRVPRRLQELKRDISQAVDGLTQKLGRSPTVADIAEHLRVSEAEVLEGLQGARAYNALSLEMPLGADDAVLADTFGEDDAMVEQLECAVALKPMIQQLPAHEQQILTMRFFDEMTQTEIGEELDISQMHVSRLLNKTLDKLRSELCVS